MKNVLFAATLLITSTSVFAQQSVVWDVNSPQTLIRGTGCNKDVDAFASTNGNDLAIVFTQLGVNLPAGGSPALADRKNCTVRVPATIAPGVYIGTLTQRISYGVIKTSGATGSVAVRSTFFGFNVSPHAVSLPYGTAVNNPLATTSRVDDFKVQTTPSWVSGWCTANRAPKGLYQSNLAVTGQKASGADDLIMFVDGLDLKYEVATALVKCQL
jgi:hypothetical protein